MASQWSLPFSSTSSPTVGDNLNFSQTSFGDSSGFDFDEVMKVVGIFPSPDNVATMVDPLPVLGDLQLPEVSEWGQSPEVADDESLPSSSDLTLLGSAASVHDVANVAQYADVTSWPQMTSYGTSYQYGASTGSAAPQGCYAPYQLPQNDLRTVRTTTTLPQPSETPNLLEMSHYSNLLHQVLPRGPSPCSSDVSTSFSGFHSTESYSSNLEETLAATSAQVRAPHRPHLVEQQTASSVSAILLKRSDTDCGSTTSSAPRKRTKKATTTNSEVPQEGKPATPYVEMIARALISAPAHRMVLADIYEYIQAQYPYFRSAPATWRNAVRHNLTANDCFAKDGRASGRGFFWRVHRACVQMFKNGDFRRMQARRLAQGMDKGATHGGRTTAYAGMVTMRTPSSGTSFQQQPTPMTSTTCGAPFGDTTASSAHGSIPNYSEYLSQHHQRYVIKDERM